MKETLDNGGISPQTIYNSVLEDYEKMLPHDEDGAYYARKVLRSFDIASPMRQEVFNTFRERTDAPEFISILSALKKATWKEIGEEPIDKLMELNTIASEDPFYAELPGSLLATFIADADELELDGKDEDSDENSTDTDGEETEESTVDYDKEPERYFLN